MATNVTGLFDTQEHAHQAVQALVAAGYDHNNISVITTDPGGRVQSRAVEKSGEMASEGAVAGATSGILVGGLIGLFAGASAIFAGPLGLVVAGPIVGLLTGAGVGFVSGTLTGAIIGLGISNEKADIYAESIRRGSVLLSMDVPATDIQSAEAIIAEFHPVNIEERATQYKASGWTAYDPNSVAFTPDEIRAERARYGSVVPVITPGADPLEEHVPSIAVGVVSPKIEDQSYFRKHFQEILFGSVETYEIYKPAYHFGFEAATRIDFKDVTWMTAEPQLRSIWEARNPGTWEKFRSAIQAGWVRAGSFNELAVGSVPPVS